MDTVWNDTAQHRQFRLNDAIMDKLAQVKPPSRLNNLIHLCVRTDDHLAERHHEHGTAP